MRDGPEIHRMSNFRIWGRTSVRRTGNTRHRSRNSICKWPAASTRSIRCGTWSLWSIASPQNCHRHLTDHKRIKFEGPIILISLFFFFKKQITYCKGRYPDAKCSLKGCWACRRPRNPLDSIAICSRTNTSFVCKTFLRSIGPIKWLRKRKMLYLLHP